MTNAAALALTDSERTSTNLTRTAVDLLDAANAVYHDRIALRTTTGRCITHGELTENSIRLARALVYAGVKPGAPVAVLADHTPETITAILGTVRAGGFYVPVDPRWPVSRSASLLCSLDVCVLVATPDQHRLAFEIASESTGMEVVFLAEDTDETAPPREQLDERLTAELWDAITAAESPVEAAGFNLDRSGVRYTSEQVAEYATRVASLVLHRAGATSSVVEIGAGSGLIVDQIAPKVGRVHAVDPSPAAMQRLTRRASNANLPVTTSVGFAHEIGGIAGLDDADVVLLASVVQYFPGPRYLRRVLHELLSGLRPGRSVVIADLIPPTCGQFPGSLRLPTRWWTDLALNYPGLEVEVLSRGESLSDSPLRNRYDVVLTVPETTPATMPAPPRGSAEAPSRYEGTRAQVVLPELRSDDLLYTISTSGSTGKPKAVAVTHRNVVNLVEWFNERNGVGADDILLQVAPFSFDLSVYDIFGVLAAGGALLLMPDSDLADPALVADALVNHPVTLWNSAPATFTALLSFLRDNRDRDRSTLRRVFLSGDWIPLSTHADLTAEFPNATLVALGGATEACVWSNDFVVSSVDQEWTSIPYGWPMRNARYLVLRDDGTVCDVDEPGELHICGDCVSLGYLNDPVLTARKFVPDPWSPRPGDRMYRTGDRVKVTAQGWIEFLGRLDQQVKIRGHRLELGDVEAAASRLPGVDEAVAVVYGLQRDPDLGLVLRTSAVLSEALVRDRLRSLLPTAMLPNRICFVTSMPVSATGKVDRRALVDLVTTPPVVPQPVAPHALPGRDDADERVLRLVRDAFAAVLGLADVGADDDFFALGGDSLRVVRLVGQLRSKHGLHVDVADFYEQPNPRELLPIINASAPVGKG